MATLDKSFYTRDDVVVLARELLGKIIYTSIDGQITSAIISETEAYHQEEKACHAFDGKNTTRTSTLFREGGIAYIYLCYGIHHLFNIVTGPEGSAQAVLIRGVFPHSGVTQMLKRRKMQDIQPNLSSGPGTLSQALGISTKLNGHRLDGPIIWLEDDGINVRDEQVRIDRRIGVDYAEDDALLPWRFILTTEIAFEKS